MNDFRTDLEFLIGKHSGTTPRTEIVEALRDLLSEIEEAEDDGPEEDDGA